MARTLDVHGFSLISQLGPTRRQRQVRKRWIAVGVAAAVTAGVAFFGHLSDRNDAAARSPAASVALFSPVAR